jgi:hypothetical protein
MSVKPGHIRPAVAADRTYRRADVGEFIKLYSPIGRESIPAEERAVLALIEPHANRPQPVTLGVSIRATTRADMNAPVR